VAKGGSYEREICRDLTAWWTGDELKDVIFWRTSQSGGRATERQKRGKHVGSSQVGDVTAIDPDGMPLTRLVTIEIKRGYPDAHLGELLDKGTRYKGPTPLESFLLQTIAAAQRANTPWWMLIHRRDHKAAMVYVHTDFIRGVREYDTEGQKHYWPDTTVRLSTTIDRHDVSLVGMRLDDFFAYVRPKVVKAIFQSRTKYGC
jgi:hypothetical protein